MSELKTVMRTSIDHNPHRCTKTYPYDQAKLTALTASMRDVGCWEGIIVRKAGRRYQAAFGHHRLKAAEKAGLERIPVIVKDLDDEDMLRYMGRENGEDYRAQFLVLLETWDAAAQYMAETSATDVARFLGWVEPRGKRPGDQMSGTAMACASASTLLAGKYITRADLKGLSVFSARELCQHTITRMKRLEKGGRKRGFSSEQIERAKGDVAGGARLAASGIREGRVAKRDIRGEVDVHSHRAGLKRGRAHPLFHEFAGRLAGQLAQMLEKDGVAERLREIKKALPKLEMQEDIETVERVLLHLGHIEKRASKWQVALDMDKVKPIRPAMKSLPGGKK